MNDWYRPLRNIPRPLTKENLSVAQNNILKKGKHSEHRNKAKGALSGMVKQGLGTRAFIERDFDKLAEWATTHDRRIIINEFGVYKPFAPRADRIRWLSFVRTQSEEHGMGWCMWEYAHEFGFAEGEPEERVLDAGVLEALGLQ
jgi:endoglucanase